MKTAAIIAEFNPLHNGHKYIIDKARRLTGADCIVIVMSGNFTQRGDIAIAPKAVRAAAAIACGADAVFELPFAYSTSSAEHFASASVALLNSLGGIDYLVFGAENDNIDILSAAAELLLKESDEFKKKLNEYLSRGASFPLAREYAFVSEGGSPYIFTPNNILAIEYIKALIKFCSPITPVAVKRLGLGYNDSAYSPDKGYISATAFRNEVSSHNSLSAVEAFLKSTLPEGSSNRLLESYGQCFPVCNDDMYNYLRYALIQSRDKLIDYADFSPALANRINNLLEKKGNIAFEGNYEDFILKLKTKNITASRIKRALLHLLTRLSDTDMATFLGLVRNGKLPYARLLAVSENGQHFLNHIRKDSNTCIINSLGKSISVLSDEGKQLIRYDILSSDIYASIVSGKFHYQLKDEYRQQVCRIDTV